MCRQCTVADCIWSDQTSFCDILENASVPLDSKWPLIILYLRGIKDTSFLSEVQKADMQELLLSILQRKDFSQAGFDDAQQRMYTIITSTYTEKIKEIARETSELAKDMHVMFGRHREDVSDIAHSVDSDLAKGGDPALLLAGLRDALKDVVAKMEQDADTLVSLSQKDSLTGMANRRCFDSCLEEAVKAWLENGQRLSLIMFDIDHFKKFNDTYGHLVGDQVLCTLANQVEKIIAPLDDGTGNILAARYGGEEFSIILRGDVASRAVSLGEVLRKTIQKTGLLLRDTQNQVIQSKLRVTVSVGVASMWIGWKGAYQSNIVDSADKALYHAKRLGRNCTVQYLPEEKNIYQRVPAD